MAAPRKSDQLNSPDQALRPFVKPGQPLGYVNRLKEIDNWPPKSGEYNPALLTTTPFLVVPAYPGDSGTRPILLGQAFHNFSIEIMDHEGNRIYVPTQNRTYFIRCRAVNLGAAAAYGAMAQFYVTDAAALDRKAAIPTSTLPLLGITGFSTPPGASVTIQCPKSWTPATQAEAQSTILVQIYDAFTDNILRPFDALYDRHVARRDLTPTWTCTFFGNQDLSGAVATIGVSSLDFDWGGKSPYPGISPNRWSMRCTSAQYFPSSGPYQFNAQANDGVRVFVDGLVVINAWINNAGTVQTGTINLPAGPHTVTVEYFQIDSESLLTVWWG